MLKNAATIFLMAVIAAQTFSKGIVIEVCKLNRDYIARNLCVNRAPSSCCMGKCFLKKELAAEEGQPQSTPGPELLPDNNIDLFFESRQTDGFHPDHLIGEIYSFYLLYDTEAFPTAVFQPPQC